MSLKGVSIYNEVYVRRGDLHKCGLASQIHEKGEGRSQLDTNISFSVSLTVEMEGISVAGSCLHGFCHVFSYHDDA